ncbi:ABC transporter permease subunit [Ruminococcus sp.]|uniref:ABC transporter permease subunit n=1 Tax=Ruminococcus sp. TaxID=41978 RepID=UPI0025ED29EF|nr:ABC transporter permease subunit [Ruminococcus sp.]MBQ8966579.1 ABC transporter permease subunit [Ruminococcus sp.]
MKKNTAKTDFIIIAVMILIAAGIAFAVIRGRTEDKKAKDLSAGTGKYTTAEDYNGRTMGILTGSSFEPFTLEHFPDSEYSYYNNFSDLGEALTQKKIDGFLCDEPIIKLMSKDTPEVGYIKEPMAADDYCFGFKKNNEKTDLLLEQFNEMLAELWSDGTMDEINEKWFGSDESSQVVDLTGFSGENGTINVATVSTSMPISYLKDGEYAGIAIELLERFCRKYGYTPTISDMDTQSAITAMASEKYDMCAIPLSVTEERKESINFSDPFYHGGIMLAVRADELAESEAPVSRTVKYTDYNGKTIGILSGTNMEGASFEYFPDSEYLYYDDYSALNIALMNGKIDAFLGDEPALKSIHSAEPRVDYIKERLTNNKYSFAFRKDDPDEAELCRQFDEFLAKANADGTIAEIDSIWFGNDDSKKLVDMSDLESTNGTIHVVTTSTDEPFSYIKDGKNVGYDIDVVVRFCREYGYGLELGDVDFPARIPALESGKYEFTTSMNVTPEREEEVMFSDPVSEGGIVVAVRAEDLEDASSESSDDIRSRPFSYYAENGKVGAITGGLYEVEILKRFPDADVLQYNAQPDLAIALSEGKIDAFTCPVSSAEDFMKADSTLTYLNETFMDIPYGIAFQKAEGKNELRDQMNEYLAKIKADDTYDEMVDIWFGNDESKKTVEIPTEGSRVLRYITASTMQPYSYIKDGTNAGLEVAIVAGFCEEYGYGLTIDNGEFGSLIAGVSGGTYDIASGTIMITEERAQSVDFSDVYYTTKAVVMVRNEDISSAEEDKESETGFFAELKDSFNKNFIRESRWKLIAEGIGTTCLITALSMIFGSVLAFLVCMFRRTGSRLANGISNIFVKLLQGTPMVVLLMILYYVVFGRSGISAVWVAVIGFTLNFGAYTSEIMRSGIDSIDGGQREAALALGYSENQAFFRFIFPQAAARFLPVYRGEVISLLKSTSIVGYIAIQDLTKMSDIIRSRTYEAFFPLIVTAVIYFLLAWVLSLILKAVSRMTDPRRKKAHRKEAA